jgi:hypothetical protein
MVVDVVDFQQGATCRRPVGKRGQETPRVLTPALTAQQDRLACPAVARPAGACDVGALLVTSVCLALLHPASQLAVERLWPQGQLSAGRAYEVIRLPLSSEPQRSVLPVQDRQVVDGRQASGDYCGDDQTCFHGLSQADASLCGRLVAHAEPSQASSAVFFGCRA